MPEEKPEQFLFTFREITEVLIKNRDLHEGLWMPFVEFKLIGTNAGPNQQETYPTAILPITRLGIQRESVEGPLTVDAAKVNPLKKVSPRKPKA